MSEKSQEITDEQAPRFSVADWLRLRLSNGQRFLLLCIVSGVLCGLAAVSFHIAISFVFNNLFEFATTHSPDLTSTQSTLRFVGIMTLAPCLAGLIVGLILWKVAPNAAGSGIPQTKYAYYRRFGNIELKEGFWRFILGTVFVGMGNSLGREGPTVHMCAAIASKVGQMFGLAKLRVQAMVPVGMGAGIAAAFNAPLSAIMFVFEELLDDFSTKALGGIVVAVVIAAVVERSILGEHPVFTTNLPHFATSGWMLICLPLGLVSALLGHVFVESVLRLRLRLREWGGLPCWVTPALGGLLVGMIGSAVFLATGQNGVFSIGYENLQHVLREDPFIWVFLALFVGKFIATIISYASGGSGGLFSPVLFLGAMLGGMFGMVYCMLFTLPAGVELGEVVAASALLGMGTFFAACIRCPLTSLIIIYEMTLNYSLILPLMAGNMIAYYLAARLRPVPLYDALLVQDGVNLRKMPSYQGKQDYHHLPVSTIMTYDTFSLKASRKVKDTLEDMGKKLHHGYPVLDDEGKLVGCITHHEMEECLREKDSENKTVGDLIAGQTPITVVPESSIRDVANTLVVKDVLQVPVVSIKDPTKLVGIVTLHDIARQQNAIRESLGR